MTITGSNTTNFGFQKLGSNDSAGYSTINEVVDGIDTILNASDRLIKASQTPTVAYVITGDGTDWVRGLVVTASITDLNVTTGKLADLAVTTGKIAADAVTLGSKTNGDYVATITGTANQIASTAATSGEGTTHTLSLVSSTALPGTPTVVSAPTYTNGAAGNTSVATTKYVGDALAYATAGNITLTGDVTVASGVATIATSAVTSAKILDNTIVLGDLATALQNFLVPTGTVSAYAGSSAPTGYLLCDGTAGYSTTTYAALFAVIGYTYGGSGGSFTVPNLKGRTVIGVGVGTEITGVLGTVQGVKEVTLTAAQSGVPAHTHPINAWATTDGAGSHGHTVRASNGDGTIVDGNDGLIRSTGIQDGGFGGPINGAGGHDHTIPATTAQNNTAAAASSAHTNIQPSMPLNYIIKV